MFTKPPARASGFEARNGFRVPQNITCSVRVNRKSALRVGLGKAEKNGFSPFRPQLPYANDFSIYPLHLSPYKVRVAFPNDCPVAHNQTLPTNAPNYRIKRVHRNNLLLCAISHASLFAGIRSRWQLGKPQRRIAGKQERMTEFRMADRNAGRHESYPVAIPTSRTIGKPSVLPV
ncbi:hypothetical protein SAMN05660206_102360 [Sphingobacterium wenxiniae]|uniref:Uncharacterized protein n=1 Tax=Sphingobacterium wenxiniae TaxID=683125 RepID=A0A1I6QIH7_9SPHI|nr:hypothetical protein SAMN05660206_102360 [Sphingobacterium wenxiniae]